MKRLLSLLIVITVLASSVMVFATSPDVSHYVESARCVVAGKAEIGNKDVAIILQSGDTIVYANQGKTDAYGNYEFKFDYKGAPLTALKILQNGETITNTVSQAKSFIEAVSAELTASYASEQDFISAAVEIKNKYNVSGTFNVIFSFYDADNALVGAPVVTVSDLEENLINTYAANIPEGTTKIKAFVWKDLTESLMPLTSSYEASDSVYEDGTVVGVIGDSITQGVGTNTTYGVYLDYIYKTRYLDRDIKFFNKGIAGDSASGALERINWDIFSIAHNEDMGASADVRAIGDTIATGVYGKDPTAVTIMLGTNTIGYNNRVEETTLTEGAILACENSVNQLESLVNGLVSKGVTNITVISPFVGVYTEQYGEPIGLNLAYAEMTRQYKAFVESYNKENDTAIKFVDVHTPLFDAHIKGAAFGSDLVHTNEYGHIMVAAEVARKQGVSPVVAQVNITSNGIEAINAEVSNFVKEDSYISYTYKPKALPLATKTSYTFPYYTRDAVGGSLNTTEMTVNQDLYNHAKQYGYDIENLLNREVIKVDGLSGNYTVSLNGTEVGTYTAQELANGINIAELEANPNQLLSQQIFKKYGALSKAVTNVRRIYANITPFGGNCASLEVAKAYLAGEATHNGNSVLNNCAPYDTLKANIISLYNEINTLANATTYTVEITKN